MAKLHRLKDYMALDALKTDIETAERTLKKSVTGEARVAAAMLAGVKANFTRTASSVFAEAVSEKYEEYKLLHGERPAEGFEDWDAGADEAIEEATQPHIDVLSQNWLGTETIDTRIHEEGELDRFAKSFATEAYKQITDKIPGEAILAELGLVADSFQYLGEEENQSVGAVIEANALAEAVRRIAVANKDSFDPIEMYDHLDNATDSDDGLAFGATAALFKSQPAEDIKLYVRALQGFRKDKGRDAPALLSDMILKEITNPKADDIVIADEAAPVSAKAWKEVAKPSERKKAAKVAKGKAVAKKQKKIEAVVNAEPTPAAKLKTIQEALGYDDTAMGKLVGVSRQSWCNYSSGKRSFTMSEDTKEKVRVALGAKEDAAAAARAEVETW